VSRREGHDSSRFYNRFTPPELSSDENLSSQRDFDKLIVGDARRMTEVPDSSVALVVTSPPYFAGKEYEEHLGRQGVPGSYLEYLDLLRAVFAECVRTLEPGGRIAVNVANLGRRPYRSLSADVTSILQDDLRLLLRGEIVWLKQRGSSGSCAWGSFQSATNPVLRDLTERVIVASKGRFDRAVTVKRRAQSGLPHESSMTRDDFMENTLDVWEIPAESARRVGHPAPFPLELPARLIELYTYRGDLVLDPFAGSGTTAVAAMRLGRHYVAYDLEENYIRRAESRLESERQRMASARSLLADSDEPPPAVRAGLSVKDVARGLLEDAGFADIRTDQRQPGGVRVSFSARDAAGRTWLFDIAGGLNSHRAGLKKGDLLWKALAKAAVLNAEGLGPFVVLTAGIPSGVNSGAPALRALSRPGGPVRAVVDLRRSSAAEELRTLCRRD
jgi:site-specific DNA-methyltransferase (adenine-specific)